MSYTSKIPFYTVRLRFTEEEVLIPLYEKDAVRISGRSNILTADFQRLFQKKVLNKGDYNKLLDYYYDGEYQIATLKVNFPQPKNRRYPSFDVEFDYLYTKSERGWLGIVPVLGVEAYSEEEEDLEAKLEESIQLNFTQKDRLRFMQTVIPTLWYEAIELDTTELQLNFLTPSELQQFDETKQEDRLPKVARMLVIPRRVAYGREAELEQLARILRGRFNRNILLVGASGVGKTALVWELAHRRKELGIKSIIWETTASTLIRELTDDVGWQQNLSLLCRELSNNGEILYVRNFLELFEVGQYAGNDVSIAEYFRTYLSRGEVNLITECTSEEFAQIEARSPGYISLFQVVRLEEPREGLEDIIVKKVNDIATLERMLIQPEAIKETIRLNRRFTPYSGFPGKPIRFLESILLNQKNVDKKQQATERRRVQTEIDRSGVIRYFCEETGMPPFMVDPNLTMDIDKASKFFRSNVFGQDPATDSVTNMLAMVKTALSRQGKPIASFLFVGPTGVGKTEMAKVLAEFMFGTRKRMVRFDMSEFSNPYDVQRLTGISYYQDGLLTAAVRREPFCVLLFDEIEKADSSFYDLLLQLLGEGRLTDSSGRLVNFCSSIIIMTSNIGAQTLQSDRIGWKQELDIESVTSHFMSEVRKHFRPELFNRIDEIIPFQPISKEVVKHVVNREIGLFKKREGIAYRDIDLNLTDEVIEHFAVLGYDPKYGARQIQRTLREALVLPLSKQLNLYNFEDKLVVNISLKEGKTHIEVQADPLKTELMLEELTRDRWSEHTGDMRRNIAKMKEGRFYLNLMSELDILKRDQKRNSKKFWANEKKVQLYTDYTETQERMEKMSIDIQDLEEDFTLVCMGLKHYNESLVKRVEAWELSFDSLKTELYKRIHPNCDCRKMVFVGQDLREAILLYINIFKLKSYDYEISVLWFRKSYYDEEVTKTINSADDTTVTVTEARKEYIIKALPKHEPIKFKAPEEDDVLVGVMLDIYGDCAGVYFDGEDGLHTWKSKNNKANSYFILSADEKKFDIPENIHRKTFFDNKKARRTYEATTLNDTEYKIKKREVPKGNYTDLLMDYLKDRLNNKIDEVLG